MSESEFERFIRDPSKRRLFEQERLIVEATELIAQVMQGELPWLRERREPKAEGVLQVREASEEDIRDFIEGRWAQEAIAAMVKGPQQRPRVTKAELAERLGKSKAYVTQILSGSRNMTLRTLADFAFALGFRVELRAVPLDGKNP